MPEEIHEPDGQIEHPDVHREETDASFAAILFILLGLIIVAFFIFVGISLFFYGWKGHETAVKKSSFPLAPAPSTDPHALPPLPAGQPRLEQEDRLAGVKSADVYDRQKAKEDYLDSSGPTQEKGFVHIPIQQAMETLAAKDKSTESKLPARAKPQDDAWRADGLIDAGESNSGREFRGNKK